MQTKVVDNFGGASAAATAVALQSDGKIVVAAEKVGPNPTAATASWSDSRPTPGLTTLFGPADVVSLRFASIDSTARGMAIPPMKRSSSPGHGIGAGVARLDTDGSLDRIFGSGGFIVLFPNRPGR